MKILLPVIAVVVIILVLVLAGWGISAVIRYNEFKTKRNQIELDRLEAEAEIDLELLKWQKTASLVELERQKQRLEANLDDMHGVEAVLNANGDLVGYMKTRKEN